MILFFRIFIELVCKYAYFIGLKYIPISKVTIIININPLLMLPIAYLVLGETITKLQIIALIGAFMGIILVSYNKNEGQNGEDE